MTLTNIEDEMIGSLVMSSNLFFMAVPEIILSCSSGISSISKAFSIISSVIGSTEIDSCF